MDRKPRNMENPGEIEGWSKSNPTNASNCKEVAGCGPNFGGTGRRVVGGKDTWIGCHVRGDTGVDNPRRGSGRGGGGVSKSGGRTCMGKRTRAHDWRIKEAAQMFHLIRREGRRCNNRRWE